MKFHFCIGEIMFHQILSISTIPTKLITLVRRMSLVSNFIAELLLFRRQCYWWPGRTVPFKIQSAANLILFISWKWQHGTQSCTTHQHWWTIKTIGEKGPGFEPTCGHSSSSITLSLATHLCNGKDYSLTAMISHQQ